MSDLFRSIRSTAGRAAFEAERIRRTASVQSVIKSLHEEFKKALLRTGETAFNLYHAGQIEQPELEAACQQVAALHAQIAAREKELETIRLEIYEEPADKPQYGHLCPNGHGELPPDNAFCHICGGAAVDVTPPGKQRCRHCGASLPAESRFCSGCGQAVSAALPPPSEMPGEQCAYCGAVTTADSLFCPECGQRREPISPTGGEDDET